MFTRRKHRPWKRVIAVIIVVLLLALVAWIIWRPLPSKQEKPIVVQQPESTSQATEKQNTATAPATPPPAKKGEAPDPATLRALTISQLGIAINYDNTLPGVSYLIERTPAGTQYVELMSDDLIGDKCTNDQGIFASIIKNPSADDNATITSTVKVDDATYGLSLPTADCTNDSALFQQYQDSIKANFPYLSASTD